MKAAFTGVAVNLALKVALVGSLAQVGLALATAVGAWINLLLVIGFAVRAGYFEVGRPLLVSLGKFLIAGAVLAAALWFTARFASVQFAHWTHDARRSCSGIADGCRRARLCRRDFAAVWPALAEVAGASLVSDADICSSIALGAVPLQYLGNSEM